MNIYKLNINLRSSFSFKLFNSLKLCSFSDKKFKIYTKTGDKGTSSLLGGLRKNKDDEVFEVLGEIDELNSYIGLCIANITIKELNESLTDIQNHLYHVSAFVASSENEKYLKDPNYEDKLETMIDSMDNLLPPLKNFINPGGCLASAHLQVARAICRRVERRYITYSRDKSQNYTRFFNRLSDYLFIASRYTNHLSSQQDTLAK